MIDKKSKIRLQNWELCVLYSSSLSIVAAMSREAHVLLKKRECLVTVKLTSVSTCLQCFVEFRGSIFEPLDTRSLFE